METILLILVVLGIAGMFFLQLRKREGGDESSPEVARLREQLAQEISRRDELTGKGKQMYESFKNLEADHKVSLRERDRLQKENAEFEVSQEMRRREHDEALEKLTQAQKTLEDEKMRVRREDEERQHRAIEERDRLWNEHEQKVITRLQELCTLPECSFRAFDNKNLPEHFDGAFKPDFLIEFLGQYIIFDAKVSRSDNFQNYVADQVKKTARKAKNQKGIYATIFLVVPTEAVSQLKEVTYYEEGFTFHVVSSEALQPVLVALKKLTLYEFAEQFDPEEREGIIRTLAKLEHHVHTRATFDVLLSKMAGEVLHDAEKVNPTLAAEVELERQKMRLPTFKTSEVKRLIGSVEARSEEIDQLTSPKAMISKKDTEAAQRMLVE